MQEQRVTIIDDGHPVQVPAVIADGGVRLSPEALKTALGWELTPEGLCHGAVCVPLGPGSPLMTPAGIDLAELAAVFERPFALDTEERVAYLGVSAHARGDALGSLEAPDFTLPDLGGRLHSLGEHRGKKVLLVAYASW